MLRLYITSVLIALSAAQFEHIPPSRGPFYDEYTLGEQGDFGRSEGAANATDLLANIFDMVDVFTVAEQVLNSTQWARVASGVVHETTKRWNEEIFDYLTFRPRMAVDVANATTVASVTLVNGAGKKFHFNASSPIFFSPSGSQGRIHPEAENATIRAAASQGVIAAMSHFGTVPFQQQGAVKVANQTLWSQLYPLDFNRTEVLQRMHDVAASGFSAVIVSSDFAVRGDQGRENRGHVVDNNIVNALSWDDLKWLKDAQPLPVVLKGVQTVEDAIMAHKIGLAGVYLSNHGGRQLDGAPASLQTLMEINKYAPNLANEIPIFADGGVYTADHALKLLALGAKMVGVGRPVQLGLALGQPGVEKMISLLNNQLLVEMKLIGVSNVRQLNPRYVNTRRAQHLIYDGPLHDLD